MSDKSGNKAKVYHEQNGNRVSCAKTRRLCRRARLIVVAVIAASRKK